MPFKYSLFLVCREHGSDILKHNSVIARVSMMQNQHVVVITGAGRGIGNAVAQAYLSRPNCVVIGTIRDDSAPGVIELKACTKGEGSKLLLVSVESASSSDAWRAVEGIKAADVDHIDVLIVNAGISPPVVSLEKVDLGEVTDAFNVNAIGALAMYQACHPLLEKSSDAKFVSISSAAGSLSAMERFRAHVAPAYCISKAALNWITLSAHCGNTWLTAFAISPGLVETDMGHKTANYLGLEKAPHTKEYSAEKIISIIDRANREDTSGRFLGAIDGNEIPW
ncbi:NAD(P)-binding protein [Hypoxylon trugodes]|uniref:NAD(P)-binding protein n=1 Tax=Hypoxylon trugodes TaxID=326681 RepID=UPI0021A032D9|nr:NAD(P)-binding protein [Hypoxylon trugodes]KAI1383483.1 NAD(P)-binding protein [Hypoxylon trugodes]